MEGFRVHADAKALYLIVFAAFVSRRVIPPGRKML